MSLTQIEISKSALTENLSQFRKIVGPAKIMAVVKSNAYGHGLELVSEAIAEKVDWFGVANVDEAVALREAGINKPILVLSFYEEDKIEEALRKNISLAVYTSEQVKQIEKAALKLRTKAKIHLKLDVQTTRVGLLKNQDQPFVEKLKNSPHIYVEGIFSHFAASEDNDKFTKKQFEEFEQRVQEIKRLGLYPAYIHIACTASILTQPLNSTNLVRLGIGLYGLHPSLELKKKIAKKYPRLELKPALTFKSKVIQVKDVPRGTNIGYGLSYKSKNNSTIAVLPIGYFDGIDRRFSNNGFVLINSKHCPIRGRICMNMMMVDASNVDVRVGDEAIFIGKQGNQTITADEQAKRIKTINYELVARLNPAIYRELVN